LWPHGPYTRAYGDVPSSKFHVHTYIHAHNDSCTEHAIANPNLEPGTWNFNGHAAGNGDVPSSKFHVHT
jgi:hypothetical protein